MGLTCLALLFPASTGISHVSVCRISFGRSVSFFFVVVVEFSSLQHKFTDFSSTNEAALFRRSSCLAFPWCLLRERERRPSYTSTPHCFLNFLPFRILCNVPSMAHTFHTDLLHTNLHFSSQANNLLCTVWKDEQKTDRSFFFFSPQWISKRVRRLLSSWQQMAR